MPDYLVIWVRFLWQIKVSKWEHEYHCTTVPLVVILGNYYMYEGKLYLNG